MKSSLYCGDCLEYLPQIPEVSIDLTVTSPPYDKLRSYGNTLVWNPDLWERVIQQLFRVTAEGGVVVWVVGDSTIEGSETGTSFKQALYFQQVGFKLHDTMIYAKKNYCPLNHFRYEQQFEYMFVFVKGSLRTFNPIKVPSVRRSAWNTKRGRSKEPGSAIRARSHITEVGLTKTKSNIWYYNVSRTDFNHPAIFPIQLARDHIFSWSNKGDVVLDPFMGSGTVGEAAQVMRRCFIGIEKKLEYFQLCEKRLLGLRPRNPEVKKVRGGLFSLMS